MSGPIDIPEAPHKHLYIHGKCACGDKVSLKEVINQVSEHSATDSEATTGDARLPSSSDTLDTILHTLTENHKQGKGTYNQYYEKAKQQIKEWAYQETLNLIEDLPPKAVYSGQFVLGWEASANEMRTKAAAKWHKS